jgi:hypothetical protein
MAASASERAQAEISEGILQLTRTVIAEGMAAASGHYRQDQLTDMDDNGNRRIETIETALDCTELDERSMKGASSTPTSQFSSF